MRATGSATGADSLNNRPMTTSPGTTSREKAAGSGGFYYAFLFLPPGAARRSPRSTPSAAGRRRGRQDQRRGRGRQQSWRGGAPRCNAPSPGEPTHPVMKALMPHVALYQIAPAHLLAVIEGCGWTCSRAAISTIPA